MKKKDIVTLKIEDVRFPNKAYGFVDGEKVIVKNGIIGQMVTAQITKKRKNGIEGRLLEVLERSPLEKTEGNCSAYEFCGGCTYQTMQHDAELDMKERQVRQLLDEVGIAVESWRGLWHLLWKKNTATNVSFLLVMPTKTAHWHWVCVKK